MKKKILIIDDSLPILNSLRMLLEMHHYDVEITQNGAYFLEHHHALPDIVLTDYHIPGMDDCSIINHLKQNDRLKHIPVILMSGDIDIEKRSNLLGANDFISKPFNLDDLLNKIEIFTSSLPHSAPKTYCS